MSTEELYTRLEREITERLQLARRAEGRHIATNDPAFVIRACERDLRVLRRHSPEPNPSSFEDKPRCAGCTHYPLDSPWPCFNDWPCDEITDMAGVYLPAEEPTPLTLDISDRWYPR